MEKLDVFYDGWCPVCRKEIDYYRKYNSDNIEFVDIRIDNIHTKYGLNPVEIRKNMHAKSGDNVYVGMYAFSQIWRRIPQWNKWADVIESRFVYPFAKIGYKIFAEKIRPKLLEKKDEWDIK